MTVSAKAPSPSPHPPAPGSASPQAPGLAGALDPRGAPPPARAALLPNLFVIGASKAGSSALHSYLGCHPDIRMSDEKEPCFFVDPAELAQAWPIMARRPVSRHWDAYLDLFAGGEEARYRGEGSVYYSQWPHRSLVPERIAQVAPDARILYLVRDPVDRAIAHYWQRAKEFQELDPLTEAVRRNAIYRDTSDYATQIGRYHSVFGADRVHVVLSRDLRTRRRETLDGIFDWLGVGRYDFDAEELAERHRSPPTSRRQRLPFVRQMRDSALWAQLRDVLPSEVVTRLRRVATRPIDKASVDEAPARAWLAESLADRTSVFEAMIGRRIRERP